MKDYVSACTAGLAPAAEGSEKSDPLLDLNTTEEQELPFLTVATLGDSDKVVVLVAESRMMMTGLEGVLATGVDGCKRVRGLLDEVVRRQGEKILGMER